MYTTGKKEDVSFLLIVKRSDANHLRSSQLIFDYDPHV